MVRKPLYYPNIIKNKKCNAYLTKFKKLFNVCLTVLARVSNKKALLFSFKNYRKFNEITKGFILK